MPSSKILLNLFLVIISTNTFSQKFHADSTDHLVKDFPIKSEGVIDVYYAYDFGKPSNNERPSYLYHYKKHDEFSLNLGMVRFEVEKEKYHGAFSIMAGTFPEYNMQREQGALKHVNEAYAGVKLANKLWLDAGIFNSHLGFESAIGIENMTLSRSISAENTPYFLSGAKLYYEGIEKWNFSFTVCNGWQNIKETTDNSNKGIGVQVNHQVSKKIDLYYNNFYSNEEPDSSKQFMFYNQVFAKINVSERIKTIIALDYGLKENKDRNGTNSWTNPTILLQYILSEPLHLGFRYEYYKDDNGIMIPTGTKNNFNTHGISLNLDYLISKSAVFRVEGRLFNAKDKIFTDSSNNPVNDNFAITSSLSVVF